MGRLAAILMAIAVGCLLFRIGIGMMRAFVSPMPEPPPPGELRRVKLRYRCPVCGLELRVTVAANEDPMPPRHCMDEMDLVATADE
jgi:hypothetical protein